MKTDLFTSRRPIDKMRGFAAQLTQLSGQPVDLHVTFRDGHWLVIVSTTGDPAKVMAAVRELE